LTLKISRKCDIIKQMKKLAQLTFILVLSIFIICCLYVFNQIKQIVVAAEFDNTLYANHPDVQDLNQRIDDNKNKIENLEKAADDYEEKIEQYKNQSASLKNQLALMDNQILKLEIDIKTSQLQIDKSKLEIESLELQVSKEEKEINSQKKNIIEYIRLINKNDQKSYLEILILNESFSEFFNQINYIEEIQNNIKKTVDHLQFLKTTLEIQKADKERKQQELEDLKQELEQKKIKLEADLKAKEILLIETKSSEIEFERLLVESKQRQNQIDTEILNLEERVKDRIAQLRTGSSSPRSTLVYWPTPAPHYITAYFHDPDYPYRYVFEHPAIDIRAQQGTPLKSPADGYVARAKDAGYGYSYITLIHDNGISTVFGHVSAIYVEEDTFVKAGEVIGLSGGMPGTPGAGRLTTGPHLHFEVRLNGIPVNPLEYLP